MLLLITSALNIKRTVNLFAELFTVGTFNFMPAVGRVVLHATFYNGNFQGATELDAQSIGGYTASGSSGCSYRVNLEHFRNILNLLSDDEPISIQGTDLELKVTGGGYNFYTEVYDRSVAQLEMPIPSEYTSKVRIGREIFNAVYEHFDAIQLHNVGNVMIAVSREEVSFEALGHTYTLSCENECVVEDFTSEDIGRFNWESLKIVMLAAFHRTDWVWIYPSFPDGPSPMIICQVPDIGDIRYYFDDEDDNW
ncbi:hypothetical protein ACOSQ4_011969 [Xanthoceras sorbifolium]